MPAKKWKNKKGTAERACACGSWKSHWINFSEEKWPDECSVQGCGNRPVLGAHIINSAVKGEIIVPMCDSCNKLTSEFDLKNGVVWVKANKAETCEK